eukprot:CAMPEP_0115563006 /NCGR_PEP_ID=MMETSP0271-20121206/101814_1 /TAXON_ID=71861 /ORGANISM="Scrippsiella trochoidea, Strain CCMP3099" /LENGTH=135 /DNA_ID=CAMNT_0002997205 /DNA_START=371 /DNA_END=779 /DNA_ORIENTATION=-
MDLYTLFAALRRYPGLVCDGNWPKFGPRQPKQRKLGSSSVVVELPSLAVSPSAAAPFSISTGAAEDGAAGDTGDVGAVGAGGVGGVSGWVGCSTAPVMRHSAGRLLLAKSSSSETACLGVAMPPSLLQEASPSTK